VHGLRYEQSIERIAMMEWQVTNARRMHGPHGQLVETALPRRPGDLLGRDPERQPPDLYLDRQFPDARGRKNTSLSGDSRRSRNVAGSRSGSAAAQSSTRVSTSRRINAAAFEGCD
jgi:hypothetical protein